jgi:hypothetical protein
MKKQINLTISDINDYENTMNRVFDLLEIILIYYAKNNPLNCSRVLQELKDYANIILGKTEL